MAQIAKAYALREVYADAYAADFAVGAFRERGITLKPAGKDRSALYLALVPVINAGQVRLLDHKRLLTQLRGLERRAGRSGRDRVDHRVGAHDDVANALATAVDQAVQRLRPSEPRVWFYKTGIVLTPAVSRQASGAGYRADPPALPPRASHTAASSDSTPGAKSRNGDMCAPRCATARTPAVTP